MRNDRVISGNGSRRGPLVLLLVGVLAAGLAVPAAADSSEPRFITAWGTLGSGDGQFDSPRGLAVASDGTVYVADRDNHRIQVFDPTGAFQGKWGGPSSGSGDGQFDSLLGVAVAPDGTVYVADTFNNRIQFFDPTGTFQGKWGGTGSGDGQFSVPRGVAVAPDGTVYVADSLNNRIQVFDPAGTFVDKWGTLGSGEGQFVDPHGVAVAPDGTIYVADTFNHRIQVFDPAGVFQGEWGGPSSGSGDGQFNRPHGVSVGPDGTVYVADSLNHRIQVFDPAGVFQGEWGGPSSGSGDGQFDNPPGVAAGLHGTVYVADRNNNRIQKFAFPSVTRAAGPNRFATAAAISQAHHPVSQSVDTVFVATGNNFPDALAGAVAAAASQSPLLLVSSLPDVTADELGRLDPDDIVILGGPAAVDAATEAALEAFGTVTRIFGANRYTTAIEISKSLFGDGEADAVVVATGENFPDALAAASLATQVNGPVLLTPTASLPQVVVDEIGRLGPSAIYVVGGTAAVSSVVLDQLTAVAPTTRIAGANRYLTAVEISKEAFPTGAGIVYVAVGTNFPDALAGAAQAAAWGAPILLTPTDALPQAVIDEIGRLDPYTIVILGGDAVVSAAVETQLKTLLGI